MWKVHTEEGTWGLDAADNTITGNTVSLDTYFEAHRNILIIVKQRDIIQKYFLQQDLLIPIMIGEAGYQASFKE